MTYYAVNKHGAISVANLSAVTTATTGSTISTRLFREKSIFISVSGNTGAVTVTIQASHDGTTWFDLRAETYTATNQNDIFSYGSHFPFMRTKTSTQSNSTVTTNITGGN